MPQGRARRYIHLIDLQGQVSTGPTQIKSRVQLTCNNINVTILSTRSNPSCETGFNTGANSKINSNAIKWSGVHMPRLKPTWNKTKSGYNRWLNSMDHTATGQDCVPSKCNDQNHQWTKTPSLQNCMHTAATNCKGRSQHEAVQYPSNNRNVGNAQWYQNQIIQQTHSIMNGQNKWSIQEKPYAVNNMYLEHRTTQQLKWAVPTDHFNFIHTTATHGVQDSEATY